MPTIEEVKKQLGSFGDRFVTTQEMAKLAKVFSDNEVIEQAVYALYKNEMRNGLFVATNQRLLFVDREFFHYRVNEFPYAQMDSIKQEMGLIRGKITISTPLKDIFIDYLRSAELKELADCLSAKLSEHRESVEAPPDQVADSSAEQRYLEGERHPKKSSIMKGWPGVLSGIAIVGLFVIPAFDPAVGQIAGYFPIFWFLLLIAIVGAVIRGMRN